MDVVADVIVYKDKVYIPTSARLEGGHLQIEPVYTASLAAHELAQVLKQVAAAGNPTIPMPTREEFQRRRDPVLNAAGVPSWTALARHGAAYAISWSSSEILLDMSMRDKKGRFVWDPEKTKRWPPETDFQTIAEAILEDARSRPELSIGRGRT